MERTKSKSSYDNENEASEHHLLNFQGTYAIPAGSTDASGAPDFSSGSGFPSGGKKGGSGGGGGAGSGAGGDDVPSPPGPDADDEESMDWWTKYFASVDAMIEVRKTTSRK